MITENSITELDRLTREYKKTLNALRRLQGKGQRIEAGELIALYATADHIGGMLHYHLRRLARATEATTRFTVQTTPHLQAHPRLRKYAPPTARIGTPRRGK
ncbi:hypothetical protein E4U03_10925 [Rothia nasimurium]|uniref:Uncharacterized protein n=1 Tax=Rothia nasimurium TaxID=85336 RepID=A0A4Y9F0Q5_9MICC|nr:hypothetical protein [Rothia nasimurium]MBF0809111.1 hypothetical protein [Rothia nasimurium]TFU20633.1 hypothetical protein E4U03_10925 [Rothia nasimurium]